MAAKDVKDLDKDDIGIAVARSNLTELVNRVRLLGQVKFLVNRGRRMAVLVPVEHHERAERALAIVEAHPQLRAQLDTKT